MDKQLRASVIIPAHNEAAVIGRCLTSLAAQSGSHEVEVVVVANGCTDDTVVVARESAARFRRLSVIELAEASKVGALNAGDLVANAAARIYLDADIELGPAALTYLLDEVSTEAPVVSSPSVVFERRSSSWMVRSYYDVFEQMPYASSGLIGLGVYGVSAAGRARFGRFPEVTADDLFVQQLFGPHERVTASGTFTVRVPRRTRDLIAVRTRAAGGKDELGGLNLSPHELTQSSASTATALARIASRNLTRVPALLAYVGVTLIAQRRARTSTDRWLRDESTRKPESALRGMRLGAGSLVEVDGVAMSPLTEGQTVAHVMAALDADLGGIIITPNVDILRQLREGSHDELIESASLLVADGMPVVWASRMQGTPLPGRVTGADLVRSLSVAAAENGRSVYLLGAAPGVAQRAAAAFNEHHPDVEICGFHSPEVGFEKDADVLAQVIDDVVACEPDLVFVAMGFPKQENVAMELAKHLPRAWFLGCGGALDMMAGDVARASPALQKIGGEWLHRLVMEPRRLARRYLVDDMPYVMGMFGRAVMQRARCGSTG